MDSHTLKVRCRLENRRAFVDWQAEFNQAIVAFQGFVSLEILSPTDQEWIVVQRFTTTEGLSAWLQSQEYAELIQKLRDFQNHFETPVDKKNITQVFVTEVCPEKEEAFKKWVVKIHRAEAAFPGFRGMYVQAPEGEKRNWITLLQFDTQENLDRWLNSSERQDILKESHDFISSIESHLLISSYAGWFSSFAKTDRLPSVWKQTMLVLLVLFPLVMLEIKHLNPLTVGFGLSLSTFIANAVSVTLLAWPLMPIAIFCLGWWLKAISTRMNLLGILVVALLYALEVWLFY